MQHSAKLAYKNGFSGSPSKAASHADFNWMSKFMSKRIIIVDKDVQRYLSLSAWADDSSQLVFLFF